MNENTAKKNFSTIGFAVSVFIIVTAILQIVLSSVATVLSPNGEIGTAAFWLLNFVPMYVVGFPVCYLILRKVPAEDLVEKSSLSAGKWIKFLIISFCAFLVGNIIGSLIGSLFSLAGINSSLVVNVITSNSSVVGSVILAIVAPVVEEIIFRKWLIDRMHVYGGRVAIVTSALMFALFHGNFAQFFYALFFGLIWGYVYYKTGKIIYTMLFHIIVNLCGGVLAPLLLSGLDMSDPAALGSNPRYLAYLVYLAIIAVLAVIGFIFIITGRKHISFSDERLELADEEKKKTPWGNPGMILFVIVCVALFVLNLVSGAFA